MKYLPIFQQILFWISRKLYATHLFKTTQLNANIEWEMRYVKNESQNICSSLFQVFLKDTHSMWSLPQFGNVVCQMRVKNPKTRKALSSKPSKRGVVKLSSRLVVNVRCLKIGTLTKIFNSFDTMTTQCTVRFFLFRFY